MVDKISYYHLLTVLLHLMRHLVLSLAICKSPGKNKQINKLYPSNIKKVLYTVYWGQMSRNLIQLTGQNSKKSKSKIHFLFSV